MIPLFKKLITILIKDFLNIKKLIKYKIQLFKLNKKMNLCSKAKRESLKDKRISRKKKCKIRKQKLI
jgi:hypothetical protein